MSQHSRNLGDYAIKDTNEYDKNQLLHPSKTLPLIKEGDNYVTKRIEHHHPRLTSSVRNNLLAVS